MNDCLFTTTARDMADHLLIWHDSIIVKNVDGVFEFEVFFKTFKNIFFLQHEYQYTDDGDAAHSVYMLEDSDVIIYFHVENMLFVTGGYMHVTVYSNTNVKYR